MSSIRTVSVIGLGYIGLPTSAAFAAKGVRVHGVDVQQYVVDSINSGQIHIVEPDLDEAVAKAVEAGMLSASLEVGPADAYMIAVPTPFTGDSHQPDISYVEQACRSIAPHLQHGNLVVLESTSPVGTTARMAELLAELRPDLRVPQADSPADSEADILLAYCPERVLPGNVMRELAENDRVVGGVNQASCDAATELYRIICTGAIVATTAPTAEMAKLTENSFRDVNIAFANELSLICDRLGIDVWELISIANRHPRVNILRPGAGVGGHCIAVDPWFIVDKTPDLARIVRTAREVNDYKPQWVVEKVKNALAAKAEEGDADSTIACYGLAFKPDIDDLRESPALEIVKQLRALHDGELLLVEPNISELPAGLETASLVDLKQAASQADIHVLLVGHSQFAMRPDSLTPQSLIVDTQGLWA